ncbi:MAG TPA: chromate efflux transporter [Thermoanaerobaculia bacterium]|nr:chromate efflux transporter [Thermoanaerobaculia bacterium]
MRTEAAHVAEHAGAPVAFGDAFRVWCRVAALSFGGPAGQIAVMQRILVDEKRWVSQERFLHALNYCMLLPGPEAQQLATYIGWLLHGLRGGLVAGTLFVLPGFVAILTLSILYASARDVPIVAAALFGLKAAVLAIVVEALVRIGKRALNGPAKKLIAALAFVGIFFFDLPFPLIVLLAAIAGLVSGRQGAVGFASAVPAHASSGRAGDLGPDAVEPRFSAEATREPSLWRSARVTAIWLALWWIPVAALWAWLGGSSVFTREAIFFSQAAVVTFGGAYAVLAYIGQRAVEDFGWLGPREMLDGLGMAETTPGPLIQVVQFVAFMGAWRQPEPFSPLLAGVLGSVVATWVTYTPCFLWIFLGAPYIEWLRQRRSLTHALSGITAAVVGVILNLAVWFALHTLFGIVHEVELALGRLWLPAWSTLDWGAAAIAALSFASLFALRWGIMRTLLLGVTGGIAIHALKALLER